VQGSDSNLYGTTYHGGTANTGTVYRISPGGNYTNLWSFSGGSDGHWPKSALVQGSDGYFYGTTDYGGTYNAGTVFRIGPGGVLTTIYSFAGSPTDGDDPSGLVQGSDSNLYGTTYYGGTITNCPYGCGTVFRISTGGTETTLYSFGSSPNDGMHPIVGLVQGSNGNFYGTTVWGGTANTGTVYRISPGGNYTNLHSFSGSDGANPDAVLVQGSDGNFYGTTSAGGPTNDGTVFRMSPSGSLTTLHIFVGFPTDGANPGYATLVQGTDGNFYGTTAAGGTSANCSGGCGTVFRISPAGSYANLYSLAGPSTDGASPQGLVHAYDGNFYGTTSAGGASTNCSGGCGTVFRFSVPLGPTNSWISTPSGKWEAGTNWSASVAPSIIDTADFITNATTTTVTIDAATSGLFPFTMTISNLYIAGTASSNDTLFLNGAGMNTPLRLLGSTLTLDSNSALVVNNSAVLATNSDLVVGNMGGNASLTISNGGALYDNHGFLGSNSTSSGNSVLVAGVGSVWSNSGDVNLGLNGSSNSLVIAAGATVYDADGYIGPNVGAGNSVLVTGNGAVWNNSGTLNVGSSLVASEGPDFLTIVNGGAVYSGASFVDIRGHGSAVLVAGHGSIWTNSDLQIGAFGSGSSLTISNGASVDSGTGSVGSDSGGNTVLVTDTGSVWNVSGLLWLGKFGNNNSVIISNGGSVFDADATMGNSGGPGAASVLVTGSGSVWSNSGTLNIGGGVFGRGTLTVASGGELFVINGGTGLLAVNNGALTLNGGSVMVDSFVANNGANSGVAFSSGLLSSAGTTVSNGQSFVVGDGIDAARFQLNGGVHSFANNLEIRTNAALTGCGTINGNVLVDAGGTVQANCGSTLDFNGAVTNNGNFAATGGTVLKFYSPVVNNGLIDGSGGDVQFFSTISNNGVILTPTNSWTDGSGKWETATNWSHATAPSSTDAADLITNAGNNTVTIDATTAGSFPGTMTIRNLTVSAPGVATNTLFLNNVGTNTPLRVLGVLTLGTNAAMVVNNSAVLGTNSVNVGNTTASSSLVVSNGGSLIVTNGSGTGSVVVNGGSLILGTGTFKTDNLVVTNGGVVQHTQTYQVDNGSITVAGGSEQAGSNLVAGTSANSTGTVTVTDAGQLVVTNGVIGIGNSGTLTNGSGVGSMIVSNGTVLANQILLGSSVGGQGQLTIQTNGLVSLVGTNAELVANDVLVDGGELYMPNSILYCGNTHTGTVTIVDGTADCFVVYVGDDDTGIMTISGGQTIVHTLLDIGFSLGSAGSVWMSGGQLMATNHPTTAIVIGNLGVGQLSLSNNATIQASTLFVGTTTGGPGGILTVAGGALTVSNGLTVGNGSVWVSGSGQLLVPSSLVIGSNGMGQITISSNGTVQANSLVLTNGANSQFAFPGGALSSGGTVVTNSQCFVIGNGSSAATFTMAGGTHWFGNGLEIANNAMLTGCGVINGAVTVDAGAHAVATCGALTFSTNVTINGNGVVRASNGSVLNFAGPVVNNGAIDALNGAVNFSSPPSGTGYVLTASCLPAVTAIQRGGSDIYISFTTCANAPYAVSNTTDLVTRSWATVTNVTGSGGIMIITNSGATLLPKRFYRVNLVVPP
jgi:uncharacterized repeat protein (TIGR03803 family)/T5SS/PEP-CTERM-associated repeat protein